MKPSEWSKAVIARDGKCMDCGLLEPLHAHHIKPKSTHPELRYDLDNGVSVCPNCHHKRHQLEGKPRVQAKKRGPHRKTLERQLAWAQRQLDGRPTRDQEMAALRSTVEELRQDLRDMAIRLQWTEDSRLMLMNELKKIKELP
jgi:hypothetical protein